MGLGRIKNNQLSKTTYTEKKKKKTFADLLIGKVFSKHETLACSLIMV